MRTLRCLLAVSFILCCLGIVSSAWSDEASIPILGAKGLVMQSGIITKIAEGKITIKDDTAKLFITAVIGPRERVSKTALMQFKVGTRVKIGDGKVSTLPNPLPKPLGQKGTLPDPLPKPLEEKGTLPNPLPRPATGK